MMCVCVCVCVCRAHREVDEYIIYHRYIHIYLYIYIYACVIYIYLFINTAYILYCRTTLLFPITNHTSQSSKKKNLLYTLIYEKGLAFRSVLDCFFGHYAIKQIYIVHIHAYIRIPCPRHYHTRSLDDSSRPNP